MSQPTMLLTSPQSAPPSLPPLENGDRLDQPTFHARYEAMPQGIRAELIAGVVYIPSPLKMPHGAFHSKVMFWLTHYEAATPGVEALDNVTVILGEDSEPQPDACLRILSHKGGRTREDAQQYLVGPPELMAEVASSSEAYDLHGKLRDYERYGVEEYLVLVIRTQEAKWFIRQADALVPLAPDADGLLRSRRFPGLWLDPTALFAANLARLSEVLQQGCASTEHAAFCRTMA